jgi:hypothetical protein
MVQLFNARAARTRPAHRAGRAATKQAWRYFRLLSLRQTSVEHFCQLRESGSRRSAGQGKNDQAIETEEAAIISEQWDGVQLAHGITCANATADFAGLCKRMPQKADAGGTRCNAPVAGLAPPRDCLCHPPFPPAILPSCFTRPPYPPACPSPLCGANRHPPPPPLSPPASSKTNFCPQLYLSCLQPFKMNHEDTKSRGKNKKSKIPFVSSCLRG